MTPHSVFDGDLLRATTFRPRRRKLVVTFRQRIGQPGTFDAARPVMGYLRNGFAHLHLQSRHNDWYINADTEAFEEVLSRFVQRYDEVIAIGFSMGGYGALRFARVLEISRAILVSPQVSIDPNLVPFDRRYRAEGAMWDAVQGDLLSRTSDMAGAVLVDPFRRLDVAHGRMICELFPKLTLVMLGNGGHPATRAIRQGGRFDWLKAQLAEGLDDPRAIGRVHRAVRHRSESYWSHLAEVAKHHRRPELMRYAQERAESLLQRA